MDYALQGLLLNVIKEYPINFLLLHERENTTHFFFNPSQERSCWPIPFNGGGVVPVTCQQDLFIQEDTWSHSNYFRNITEIQGMDPGCLWEKKGPLLVLVDDDQYIAVPYEKHKQDFTPVSPPEPG